MKIRKKQVDKKFHSLLKKENDDYSIDEMAQKYGIARNAMGDLLRLGIATDTIKNKILTKQKEEIEA